MDSIDINFRHRTFSPILLNSWRCCFRDHVLHQKFNNTDLQMPHLCFGCLHSLEQIEVLERLGLLDVDHAHVLVGEALQQSRGTAPLRTHDSVDTTNSISG